MRDVEPYQQLLGVVSPWTVGRVEWSVEGERVDVWVRHGPDEHGPCPECGTLLSLYLRPSCMPARLASRVPRTGLGK